MTSSFLHHPSSPVPELRLFISSTFLDMQDEREHLVKKVFPEIRQLCRERGIVFTEVDLRWGITEQQAKRRRIVSTCLDEIGLRKPYVITLVGERYGWQPGRDDLGDGPGLLKRYPWIDEAVGRERSLVELESLEAALNDPEMRDRVRFYFKHNGDGKSADDIEAFRARARNSGLPLREGYRTPKGLGEWVREDLLALLDTLAPADHEVSWLERERRGHEAFAISRRQAYVENPRALEKLDRYVAAESEGTPSVPLVITGESGSGKSALLAWWSDRFRREHPEAFVVTHHIGATALSGDHVGLMRRVAWEIRERYGINEEPPVDPETLVQEFPSWLARTQNESLILVVDALNQLEPSAQGAPSLGWLPEHFPSSVRLVISTIHGPVADGLTARRWKTLRVTPLNKSDRRRVVREFLGHYGKEIETRQIRRIVEDRKTANPLYLRTSLEELRVTGEHDRLDERIDHYLEAVDLNDLFQRILGRLEEDFGAAFTESVMRLLWASRNGLSEDELLGILECPRLRLTQLLHALEYHLMRRDGLLTFYHDHLRQGVESRYLDLVRSRRAAHRKIAAWFSEQGVSPRRAEEEPWGWMGAAKSEDLVDCVTNPELLAEIITNEGYVAFFRYRNALPEKEWPELLERITSETIRYAKRKKLDPAGRIAVANRIGLLMREAAAHAPAEQLIREAHTLALEHYGPAHRTVAALLSQLGTVLQAKGDYREAEKAMREGLETLETMDEPDMLEYAEALDNLGSLLYALRDYKPAEPLFRKALKIRRKRLGEGHVDTILSLGNLGAMFHGMGKDREARKHFQLSLELSERTFGKFHPETAAALNNIATTYQRDEKYEEAIPPLERALKIYRSLYGEYHPDFLAVLSNTGHFHSQAGYHKKAEETYLRALALYNKVCHPHHPSVARCHINLGTTLWAQKKLDQAEEEYRSALEILRLAYGDSHVATHSCWLDIGGILLDKGQLEDALEIYRRSLPIKEAVLGRNHPEVELTYQRLTHSIKTAQQVS